MRHNEAQRFPNVVSPYTNYISYQVEEYWTSFTFGKFKNDLGQFDMAAFNNNVFNGAPFGGNSIMTEVGMNDSITSATSTVYHGVMTSSVCELRAMRQNCLAMITDYVTRFDQALGVAPEIMEENHRVMDEDRRTIFKAVSNYWVRANQLCDADSIEGRADLNATLKAIEGMRRNFDRTKFFNVDFRYLKQNKLPTMRIPTKNDNGMIYAFDDPEYPVPASTTEDSNGLPPSGSKRGRDQASPGSVVQQKKKGPAGPRHSSPIVVPDEPRRCYLNRDNPTLGNGQRVFDIQSIVDVTNVNPGTNGTETNVEKRDEANENNSAGSDFLVPPPPTAIRRTARTAAWVSGQSPALLDPASNVVSVAPGAIGGAISRQPASAADPTLVSSSSGPAAVSSSRAPNIFKEVKDDNEKLKKEKTENDKKLAAQDEKMKQMKAEMEKMKQEKAEKSRLEKERKEKKKKDKEEKANAAAAAAAAAAQAAANAAAVEAAKQAAANAAAEEEREFRRQNEEMREANRLMAEEFAKRDAEMEEMRRMMEDLCRPSEEEEEEEEEDDEPPTEYVPLGIQPYEPIVESNRQPRSIRPSPQRRGVFGAGNGFPRASQSVPANGANLSRAIANICEVGVDGRPQGRLQRKTTHLSMVSLPIQNVDATRISSTSEFLMEKRIAMESAKEARPEKRFDGGSVVAYRAMLAIFDNNTQSSGFGPREKLIELQKYVSGPPATMVASHMLNPNSEEAYSSARRDLDNVYGATPESSWAMLDEIKAGGQIAEDDVVGLQKFLAAAMMTHAMAKTAGKDAEMTHPSRLKEIVEARAFFLMRSFAAKVLQVRDRENRNLDFEDFRALISDHISIMQLCKGRKSGKQHAKVAFTTGNDVETGNGERYASAVEDRDGGGCGLCKKDHQTQYCEQMTDLDSDARFKKLIHNNICVRCMISGHHQKDCPAPPPVCLVCRGRHHSALHRNALPTQKLHPAQIRQQNRRQNNDNNNAGASAATATSPKTTVSTVQGGSSA